ncbi:MAG: ATP-dependent DNA helicase, partial [Kiritimatiellae bacterium]|nr:ATP-dependent DNA helicase [Kiritimatiellia bacterium]
EHFGLRLSPYMIEHWCRRLYHPERARGLLGSLRDGPGCTLIERVWEAQQRQFFDLEQLARFDAQENARRVSRPIPTDGALADALTKAGAHLANLAQDLEQTDRDTAAELRQAARRAGELQSGLTDFLEQRREDHVYWLACEGRRRQTVMYTAPIEVAPLLREWMFQKVPCVVMTSATLAVHGSLEYFMERVGARGIARAAIEGSPFEYERQMRIVIPERMPEPNAQDYHSALTEAIARLSEQQGGGTLVLFTNASLMRRVAEAARPRIQNAGLRLMVQGQGTSRTALLEEFRLNQGAVLFGLESFWMGVDVRGEALRQVVITRLPFAVPDHPLIRARMDRIKERGGDPFREYSLPEAVIQFRQGVGRLIRTATDQGVVAVLDRRIVDRWYGRWFREALPECPVETADLWTAPPSDADEDDIGGENNEL